MTIGSTLADQIYKEGEPTWGCKSGVLDVEDVKIFIGKVKRGLIESYWEVNNFKDKTIELIDELAGVKIAETTGGKE